MFIYELSGCGFESSYSPLSMTTISKNVYSNKLDDIVNEYNNTYHRTIKMKPLEVQSSTYNDFGIENNEKDPKLEVNDHVRISKYKNNFAKGCTPNWSEQVFVIKIVENTVLWAYVSKLIWRSFLIKKVKCTVPWTYVIEDLKEEKYLERFTKKNCKRQPNRI